MVLKPTLTVDGKEYEVFSLTFRDGVADSVTIFDKSQNCITYRNEKLTSSYIEENLKLDFSKALRFIGVKEKIASEREKLIAHLDEMHERENQELIELAIDAMEGNAEEPFALNLVDKQRDYKFKQQRLMGLLDAIEEVKAYTEGYYANGNDAEVEA